MRFESFEEIIHLNGGLQGFALSEWVGHGAKATVRHDMGSTPLGARSTAFHLVDFVGEMARQEGVEGRRFEYRLPRGFN